MKKGLCLAALGLIVAAGTAMAAFTPTGSDSRISNLGTEGDGARQASSPDAAYNPAANNYLVVWEGDGSPGSTDDQYEIWGQMVSATGTEIGIDFKISNATDATPMGTDRDATDPKVAYNSVADEFLVVWGADRGTTDNEGEVWGQRISAAGAEIGTNDFKISNIGADGDTTRGCGPNFTNFFCHTPAIAYNPAADQYLVTWRADGLGGATDEQFEIFGQLLSGTGAEVGLDFQVSSVSTDPTRDVGSHSVRFNPAAGEYLSVFSADGLGGATDERFEIFGQRITAAGAEVGTNDFRISNATDVAANRDAREPRLAYATGPDQYLVTWEGDALGDEVFEIYGQLLGATGTEVGTDFRISNNTDVAASHRADNATPAYNPARNEFIVVWGDLGSTPEEDVRGQELSAAGAAIGGDYTVSGFGSDASTLSRIFEAGVVYNSVANEYLVTFQASDTSGDDNEVYGHRLTVPPAPDPDPTPTGKCKGKAATVVLAAAGQVTRGTAKRDVIVGNGAANKINAGGGNDLVCAGAGNDTVNGGGGKDQVFAGKGKDTAAGQGGNDKLSGEAGKDRLTGGAGKDRLLGGKGPDTLRGGGGNDFIRGGPGKDTVNGGPGKDNEKQ